jgi:hypothetical protein
MNVSSVHLIRQGELSFDEMSFFDVLPLSGADVFGSAVVAVDVWLERFL